MATDSKSLENKFVQSLRRGETFAFDYFFNKYSCVVYFFAYSYLKSKPEAEEIVQEAFLRLWENRKKLDPAQSLKAYLFTIALNIIRRSFLEKSKNEKFKLELYDVLKDEISTTPEEINYHEYLTILEQEINKLPEKRKEVFILHKKEGLTVKEVAEQMNISPKTVENQLTSAIKSIREAFKSRNINYLHLFLTFISRRSGYLKMSHS